MRRFVVELITSVPKGLWAALGVCTYIFFFAVLIGSIGFIEIG